MKAITNQLIVSFDYKKIDSSYDFYAITTSGKYIPYGAKCLDNKEGKVRFESIAFENGKTLYSMAGKGAVSLFDIVNGLDDDTLSVKKVDPKDIPDYMLFRLFLFSLNNFTNESLSFNNLTGKFYISQPGWMKRNGLTFTAISISIDKDMTISLEGVTFAKCSMFKDKKAIKDYPRYVFANKNYSLKRVFEANDDDTYVKKGVYNKKADIPFFALGKNEIKSTKVYFLYHVLDLLLHRFGDVLAFEYQSVCIAQTIGVEKDKDFMRYALEEAKELNFNFVNFVVGAEYEEEFSDLVGKFGELARIEGAVADSIDEKCANIVLIHNSDYYEQQHLKDPHSLLKCSAVSQCITVEDSASRIIADNKAIIDTIIKEIVIKNDIIKTKKISLDKWASYGFDIDWIFGKEHEGRHYFMIVHPDGSFDLYNKPDGLRAWDIDILNECSDCLTDNKGKDVTVIATCDGDINVLTKTNRYPLPSKQILELDFISRSKDSRDKYLAGVVDINFYEEDKESYCSVGIKGSGMNTKIIRAPHLYKVDVISGNNVIGRILSSMSVTFVKYKSFTVLPYPVKYLNEYITLGAGIFQ